MKFRIENLGAIRYADLEMGNITVLCGMNNSGKTYVTYAIYGFFSFWKNSFVIPIESNIINELKNTGVCNLQLSQYIETAPQIIGQACKEYKEQLASVFSSKKNRFEDVVFEIDVSPGEITIIEGGFTDGIKSSSAKNGLAFNKEPYRDELTITLFSEDNTFGGFPDFIIFDTISNAVKDVVFRSILPNAFIASVERTGAAIFRRELNFARNKLLDILSKSDKDIYPTLFFDEWKSDYAWPVGHNVDFTRNLDTISKSESDIYTKKKEIIDFFMDIVGGDYQVTSENELFFIPAGKTGRKTRLTMDESSSSVRALLDIGFYLKHTAQFGDVLMIDEPELNLHPHNQRKVARLLARLVNCGMKIFITTHSDYILRELNNLILMNGNAPHLAQIMEREGYTEEELLKTADTKIYTAEEGFVLLPSNRRRSKVQSLIPVEVDTEIGIHSSTFDGVISDMNRITDDIMFGG